MPFTITHDPRTGIVEVALTGSITGDDLREATTRCTSLQKQTDVMRFLLDANGWNVSASFVDIYDIPDKQYWKEELSRQSRIAVILPTSLSARKAARFYETTCRNRGWNARVFPDRRSAIDWLQGMIGQHKSDEGNG